MGTGDVLVVAAEINLMGMPCTFIDIPNARTPAGLDVTLTPLGELAPLAAQAITPGSAVILVGPEVVAKLRAVIGPQIEAARRAARQAAGQHNAHGGL